MGETNFLSYRALDREPTRAKPWSIQTHLNYQMSLGMWLDLGHLLNVLSLTEPEYELFRNNSIRLPPYLRSTIRTKFHHFNLLRAKMPIPKYYTIKKI